jgi:hypothetical protein
MADDKGWQHRNGVFEHNLCVRQGSPKIPAAVMLHLSSPQPKTTLLTQLSFCLPNCLQSDWILMAIIGIINPSAYYYCYYYYYYRYHEGLGAGGVKFAPGFIGLVQLFSALVSGVFRTV